MCPLHLSLCGIWELCLTLNWSWHPMSKVLSKNLAFTWEILKKARRVLTEDATKTVMQSLVMSRLDSCNALLIGIQQDLIAKLQRLQNSAARIVSRTRKYEHITPVLIKLHRLPIKLRIQFKVLLLVYKALNRLAPKYIKELLVPYKPRSHLRSEAKGLLDEPRTRLKFGDRAFSISAPRLWNALPQHLKDFTSCQAFTKCLITHLFRLVHWGVVDYDLKLWQCAALLNILWMEMALYKFQLLLSLFKESNRVILR